MPFAELEQLLTRLLIPCILLALAAKLAVHIIFSSYSIEDFEINHTGAEAAEAMLAHYGITDVTIERVSGKLTDHYLPSKRIIRLSEDVYDKRSPAAIGAACHEVGHAIQYHQGYVPVLLRAMLIPITTLGSKFIVPVVLIGIYILQTDEQIISLLTFGIWFFSLSVILQIITLPIEFNASQRALTALNEIGILNQRQLKGARYTLIAAAMTYVAATAAAITMLLKIMAAIGRRRRR